MTHGSMKPLRTWEMSKGWHEKGASGVTTLIPSVHTLHTSQKKKSLTAKGWIRDKTCHITIDTRASVTTATSDITTELFKNKTGNKEQEGARHTKHNTRVHQRDTCNNSRIAAVSSIRF
jgi:hypothetical protein